VNAGGVEAILAAARAHVGSARVSRYACRALGILALDVANRVRILF
jgi:hypothetical protein